MSHSHGKPPKASRSDRTLECIECGKTDQQTHGWKAHLTIDDNVAVYCPECADREFGELRR